MTAAQDGTIQLWDATQICRVLNTVVEPRFDCPEKWCSAQFSAHPRQLMVTDRTGITVWDTRVGDSVCFRVSECLFSGFKI